MSQISIDELETSADSYWGIRVRKFLQTHPDDAMEKVKEALLNDAAAWSVFAALLMTVGFAALTISNGDFDEDNEMNDVISILYVIFNTLSGGLSFLAVIQGTQTYSYYNNLPPMMMDKAIARSKQFNVAHIVYVAISKIHCSA